MASKSATVELNDALNHIGVHLYESDYTDHTAAEFATLNDVWLCITRAQRMIGLAKGFGFKSLEHKDLL